MPVYFSFLITRNLNITSAAGRRTARRRAEHHVPAHFVGHRKCIAFYSGPVSGCVAALFIRQLLASTPGEIRLSEVIFVFKVGNMAETEQVATFVHAQSGAQTRKPPAQCLAGD